MTLPDRSPFFANSTSLMVKCLPHTLHAVKPPTFGAASLEPRTAVDANSNRSAGWSVRGSRLAAVRRAPHHEGTAFAETVRPFAA